MFIFLQMCEILADGNVRVQSVRIGHESSYYRADTLNNNINKRSNRFTIKRN